MLRLSLRATTAFAVVAIWRIRETSNGNISESLSGLIGTFRRERQAVIGERELGWTLTLLLSKTKTGL